MPSVDKQAGLYEHRLQQARSMHESAQTVIEGRETEIILGQLGVTLTPESAERVQEGLRLIYPELANSAEASQP